MNHYDQLLAAEANSLTMPMQCMHPCDERRLESDIKDVAKLRAKQRTIDARLVVLGKAWHVTNSRDVELAIASEIRRGLDDIDAMEDEITEAVAQWTDYASEFDDDLEYRFDRESWRIVS